ncbi:hypothetical protein GCM10009551_047980 [Nocardiopsis tropica]
MCSGAAQRPSPGPVRVGLEVVECGLERGRPVERLAQRVGVVLPKLRRGAKQPVSSYVAWIVARPTAVSGREEE